MRSFRILMAAQQRSHTALISLYTLLFAVVSPLIEGCAMHEAGTESRKYDVVALLEILLVIPHGERNSGCTRVAVTVDISKVL